MKALTFDSVENNAGFWAANIGFVSWAPIHSTPNKLAIPKEPAKAVIGLLATEKGISFSYSIRGACSAYCCLGPSSCELNTKLVKIK